MFSFHLGWGAMQYQLLISLHWDFCTKSLKYLWEQGKCTHLMAGTDSTRQWKTRCGLNPKCSLVRKHFADSPQADMCCLPRKPRRDLHTALSRGSPNYQPRVWGTETGSAFISRVAVERTLSWCKLVKNLLSEHQQLCVSKTKGSLRCLQPSSNELALDSLIPYPTDDRSSQGSLPWNLYVALWGA